ncbi:MAG: hypothetical protein WA978_11905, partial [Sphingopyxis granuli]|uniref:hypothetical protein n=1 Tax=Sphingopyxis granuli TaxID=267128 RepID=UPI003C777AF7
AHLSEGDNGKLVSEPAPDPIRGSMVCARMKGGTKGKVRSWMLKRVQHDERMRQRAEIRIPADHIAADPITSDRPLRIPVLRHFFESSGDST